MLSKLISEHQKLKDEIDYAIKGDDLLTVQSIDKEIISNWNRILSFTPFDDGERRALVEFLLEQLVEVFENGKTADDIKRKILEMI